MIVKNTTSNNISVNKSVQIDINTLSVNDGYILGGQILDLAKSLTDVEIMESEQIKKNIYSGAFVFVVDGLELSQNESIQIYESGAANWAKIFNPTLSQNNLYEGLAGGFIYAKNCLIG